MSIAMVNPSGGAGCVLVLALCSGLLCLVVALTRYHTGGIGPVRLALGIAVSPLTTMPVLFVAGRLSTPPMLMTIFALAVIAPFLALGILLLTPNSDSSSTSRQK